MIILSLLTLVLSCYFFFKTFKYKKNNVALWKVYYFLLVVFSILTFVSDALIKDGGLDNFIILVCGFILMLLVNIIMCLVINLLFKNKFKFKLYVIIPLTILLYGVMLYLIYTNINFLLTYIIYIAIILITLFILTMTIFSKNLNNMYLIYGISLLSLIIGLLAFYFSFDFMYCYIFILFSSCLFYIGTFKKRLKR